MSQKTELKAIDPKILREVLLKEYLWTYYQVKDLLKVLARKHKDAQKS